ncbi:MAG: gfo/Idh/MocA family oxidoreductase [Saprospirales bacterium]|nr:MAG: gfo/Idh/MocA family oxidoreductase [Saprospirales bacterium]
MKEIKGKKFALIGASGYVAPRHMKAIASNDGELIAACDPYDGAGVIDRWFPEAGFFTEFERFDRHVEKLKRAGVKVDYFSICSPNYLHDAHVRFALRYGADAICEKPLVLNPWNLDALEEAESQSGGRIFNILQLRLHPEIIALKKKVEASDRSKRFLLDLTYITSRGKWYFASWKGDTYKSGGVATNIGIHFFDMLIWIFGGVKDMQVHCQSHDRAAGWIELERAEVRWFLSINAETLPPQIREKGLKTYRNISMDGNEIEFSSGFEDLHDKSYSAILHGQGFGIEDSRPSIELVHRIRTAASIRSTDDREHPLTNLQQSPHPFGNYPQF